MHEIKTNFHFPQHRTWNLRKWSAIDSMYCIFYHSKFYITSNLVTVQSGSWPEEEKMQYCIRRCKNAWQTYLPCALCETWHSSWQICHREGWGPLHRHTHQSTWNDPSSNKTRDIMAYLNWLICWSLQSVMWRRSKCSSSISSLLLSTSLHCFSTTW